MTSANAPYYPIIYVRGYAMTESEKDDTAADPFCGFNIGSTVYRATTKKDKALKFVFESPVLRLMTDYNYCNVYHEGLEITDPGWDGWMAPRSIIIYRYYDQDSTLLGAAGKHSITEFAKGLNALIMRVRELMCRWPTSWIETNPYQVGDCVSHAGKMYRSSVGGNRNNPPSTSAAHWLDCGVPYTVGEFRCYLVAHSMGGLICRAFLQDPDVASAEARGMVDKFFTYATPHNGIELAGVNVPAWLSLWDVNTFAREKMVDYLNLADIWKIRPSEKRVDYLPQGAFPSRRVFCMVGTNRADYQAAAGISRTFAGNGSDGLVKIANASVWGISATGAITPCATAYTYRSHSGYFGIVNSEESYQNLSRFLFGNVRVDIFVDVDRVQLPLDIQGKAVDALYQFELLASPLGKHWYLSRRISEEDSVACRTLQELTSPTSSDRRQIYMSTIFLADSARVNRDDPSLHYSLTLGIRVPDYDVGHKFWLDSHVEGAYLFRRTLMVRIRQSDGQDCGADYHWQDGSDERTAEYTQFPLLKSGDTGEQVASIAFDGQNNGRISGQLRFVVSNWNR